MIGGLARVMSMTVSWHRRRRPAMGGLVLAALLLLLGTLPAAAVTGTTDPTMRTGHHDAPIAVPGGTYATMTALALPKGAWFVTAKAVIMGTPAVYGHYGVTCTLVAGADFDTVSATPQQNDVDGSAVPIWLTVVHRFASDGKAKLRCVAESPNTVEIRLIKMTALRAGRLSNGPVGGSATTSGSGAPRVISRFRDATSIYAPSGAFHQIVVMPIPEGLWSIQAKAILAGGPGPSATIADCSLLGSSNGALADYDTKKLGLSPIGSGGDQSSLGLEIVGGFAGGANSWVQLGCTGGNGFQVSWIKITAVELGKVTFRPLLGGSSSTYGSGTPRVIYGIEGGPIGFVASSAYMTVRSMRLPAGRWSVSSSLWLEAGGAGSRSVAQCKLVLGADEGRSRVVLHGTNAGREQVMYLQVNERVDSPTDVRLRCKRTNGSVGVTVNWIHFVAVKAGSMSDTGL